LTVLTAAATAALLAAACTPATKEDGIGQGRLRCLATVLTTAPIVVVFAQRAFMQGVTLTEVKG
jgi:hypothetical protein